MAYAIVGYTQVTGMLMFCTVFVFQFTTTEI